MNLNIYKSEYYKFTKSRILKILILLPAILPIFYFTKFFSAHPNTLIESTKYTFEMDSLFALVSEFTGVFSMIIGLFVVLLILGVFYIDRRGQNIPMIAVSFSNLFNLLISKLLFVISIFSLSIITLFFSTITMTVIVKLINPELIFRINIQSALLIFLVFAKIFIVNVGMVSLVWLIGIISRNFIAIIPASYIIGVFLDLKILPFSNGLDFFMKLTNDRKLTFKNSSKASIFNSLEFNWIDANSVIWFALSLILIFLFSKNFRDFIIKNNGN